MTDCPLFLEYLEFLGIVSEPFFAMGPMYFSRICGPSPEVHCAPALGNERHHPLPCFQGQHTAMFMPPSKMWLQCQHLPRMSALVCLPFSISVPAQAKFRICSDMGPWPRLTRTPLQHLPRYKDLFAGLSSPPDWTLEGHNLLPLLWMNPVPQTNMDHHNLLLSVLLNSSLLALKVWKNGFCI